jgi:hypothetical protein
MARRPVEGPSEFQGNGENTLSRHPVRTTPLSHEPIRHTGPSEMKAFPMETVCSQGYRKLLPSNVHSRLIESPSRSDRAPGELVNFLGKGRRAIS